MASRRRRDKRSATAPRAPGPDVAIRLGVNVDHVATLRSARGVAYPSPVEAALRAARAGADGITVHLREDRRHIQDADVRELRQRLAITLNLEMAVTDEMVSFALDVRPDDVCLVPERRQELTTEGGLDVVGLGQRVIDVTQALRAAGVRVNHFVDAEPRQVEMSQAAGAHGVELHTGDYANASSATVSTELARLRRGAERAAQLGLEVHAGHGLTLDNVGPITQIPDLVELNIGHSIVARAVFVGIEAAVREMKARLT